MKFLLALALGLAATGAAMAGTDAMATFSAFSELALAAPAAIQSYLQYPPEPGPYEMGVAGVAAMLFVALRRKTAITE